MWASSINSRQSAVTMNNPNQAGLLRKAVFFDRDGVINFKLPVDRYVRVPEEFRFIPGSIEALSMIKGMGFLLVLTTNQRGIGRGFINHVDVQRVHEFMQERLARSGASLDVLYYCPHDLDAHCSCRKPEPGMILAAAEEHGIDLSRSYMVGDSLSDIEAGSRAGTRTVCIGGECDAAADMVFSNLLEFAHYLRSLNSPCKESSAVPSHDRRSSIDER